MEWLAKRYDDVGVIEAETVGWCTCQCTAIEQETQFCRERDIERSAAQVLPKFISCGTDRGRPVDPCGTVRR